MAEPCWVSSSRGRSAYVHLHTHMRMRQAPSPPTWFLRAAPALLIIGDFQPVSLCAA